MELHIPSYSTQQKIAAILDNADELRRKDQQLLYRYDDLLQSIFYQMFGDPVKNEKGWDTTNLGLVCKEFKYGTNEKSFDYKLNGAIPIIRIPNVLNNVVNYNDLKFSVLSSKEYEEVKLKKGDLLFVRTNGNPSYIGRCAVFGGNIEAGYASYLIRARLNDTKVVLPEFIQSLISSKTYRPLILKKATTTAGNYNINTVALKSLPIIIPEIALQRKYVSILEKTDFLKQKTYQSLNNSESLFHSLLQKAFKGELVN
jgi:type I restriction enzyme S subunit